MIELVEPAPTLGCSADNSPQAERVEMPKSGLWPELVGRRDECDALSALVASAENGRSRVVVLRGEAGIGKTALLEFLAVRANRSRVVRAAGVESELELP
jgi:ATP-dependent Clp protease ATP-binding subunit ClpA